MITIKLNGSNVEARRDMTILDLCKEKGISIPTLCYHTQLTPTGACRLCVVEVEGSRTLVASCHTPVASGMIIQTNSPKVIQARKMIVELLLSTHPDFCPVCDKANVCELRMIAADLGVGLPRFRTKKRYYPIEDDNPYIIRDLSKCVLCFRCVKACREVKVANVYSVGYRGHSSKIIVDCDQPLNKEVCRQCDVCVLFCPVGALVLREERFGEISRKPFIIKG
ncbi:MAG: 2Fe-2S iron-sulfur cluster-binding protein [Nitrospirota bacterium]